VARDRVTHPQHPDEREKELIMSVQVTFTGICTHTRAFGPGTHRVILVHAENGAYINSHPIPPHIPTLFIDPAHFEPIEHTIEGLKPTGKEGEWRMCGVQLSLEGALGPSLEPQPTYARIPSLGDYASVAPGPSDDVTSKGQAACYFDLSDCGRISSDETEHGARYAIWETDTDDSPALVVTPFLNRAATTRIQLKQGAKIGISHTGKQQGDSDWDFLLHYCILEYVPEDADVPHEPKFERNKNPNDISMGCSNSQYP
jgi:hypothetical protein